MAATQGVLTIAKGGLGDTELQEHFSEYDRDLAARGIEAIIADLEDAGSLGGSARAMGSTTGDQAPDGVYYINFTPQVQGQYREELKAIQADVDSFRSWATGLVGIMVDRQIKDGKLDGSNISKVSSYRAKALDVVYAQRNTVLNQQEGADNSDVLSVKEKSFHADIIKTALKGFRLGADTIKTLDEIIDSVVKSLTEAEKYRNIQRRYFILATTYIFDTVTRTIKVQMRTINFQSTNETFEVSAHKSTTTYVKVNVAFSGYNYDYNRAEWLKAKETSEVRAIIDQGRKRMGDDPTKDVPVDP